MKCVILLSLVALCYSLPTTYGPPGKNINISDDGTITISTVDGKKVVISKAIGTADRFIDVSVEGPNVIPKRIQIDSQSTGKSVNVASGDNQFAAQYGYYVDTKERDKRSPKVAAKEPVNKTQGAILTEIFTDYQGVVDNKSYIKLLGKVSDYVESGQLDPSIYDVLAYLNEQRQQEQQEQIDTSTNPAKTWRQAMWESWVLNYLRSRAVQQNPQLGSSQQTWEQQSSAGQPWNAQQPAGPQWTGQPWNAQPWNTQSSWPQQTAGQQWAGQPWNAQQTVGQQWPVRQTVSQPWNAQPWNAQPWNAQPYNAQPWAQQTTGQPWNAQQDTAQQWPAQQWTQPTGRTAVPLQRTQGPR